MPIRITKAQRWGSGGIAGAALLVAAVLAACSGVEPAAPAESPPATVAPPAESPAPSEPAPVTTGPDADTTAPTAAPAPPAEAATAEEAPVGLVSEPLIYITPQTVRQGSVFLVVVDAPGAGAASVAYNDEFYSLVKENHRFFTILPVAARAPVGPAPITIAIADASGHPAVLREAHVTVEEVAWPVENLTLANGDAPLLQETVVQENQRILDEVQRQRTPERLWRGYFVLPAPTAITGIFGTQRSYDGALSSDFHSGLDLAGGVGDPVTAPNSGVVIWVGETARRGTGLIIDHGGGVLSGYWHLNRVLVEPGTTVRQGGLLAEVGDSGLSTGPHLHFEIVVHGVPVDPLPWLRELEVPDPTATFDPATTLPAELEPGPSTQEG